MKKSLLKISTAVFLSALVWINGDTITSTQVALADSGQESVSRTQIEQHFNRPTRRTRKKIEEAKQLRLQRYSSQKTVTVPTPTIIHTSEAVCNKSSVYGNPHVYEITRKRLVDRVAKHMGIDTASAMRILKFPQSCVSVGSLPINTGTKVMAPKPTIQPVQQPVKREYVPRSGKETVITTTRVNPTPVVISVPNDGNNPETVLTTVVDSELPKEALFPPAAKIRVLCRVQERGYANRTYFDANIETIAQQFATRWNTDISVIAEALQSPNLCASPHSPRLLALLESGEIEVKEEPLVQPAPVETTTKGFLASAQQKMHTLLSLPKALLVVGTLAFITFLILVGLLIAPLVQKTKNKDS